MEFAARPRLVDKQNGQEFRLLKNSIVIGRHKSCDIVLPVVEVSRRHARIFLSEGLYYIEDLRTVNGTFVNEEVVMQPHLLMDGCHIKIARCTKFPAGAKNYIFRFPEEEALKRRAKAKPAPPPVPEDEEAEEQPRSRPAAAAPAPDELTTQGGDPNRTPLRHCIFRVARRKEEPRKVPMLKFAGREVRFLSLVPLAAEEPLMLTLDYPTWDGAIGVGIQVQRVTRIKNREAYQVEAAIVHFVKGQQERYQRLVEPGALLMYFS